MPNEPYIKETPNPKKPDATDPKQKYFIPASIELWDFISKAANTYRVKLKPSKVINKSIKSKTETKSNKKKNANINTKGYSLK